MIEKLRRKFILIMSTSVFLVMGAVLVALNISNYVHANNRADQVLAVLAENDGSFPEKEKLNGPPKYGKGFFESQNAVTVETPFDTRYFSVVANAQKEVIQINTTKIESIDSKEGQELAETVLDQSSEKGNIDDFRYWVIKKENQTNFLLFMDNQRELQVFRNFLRSSLIIGSISFAIILLLVVYFSKKVVKPVEKSLEKQKQFITNAGHEIKTPLAIISANNDVQELLEGENEWTQSSRTQIIRLNQLVENMLFLSRLEEMSEISTREAVDFSKVVEESVCPYRLISEHRGMEFHSSIQKRIIIQANQSDMETLLSILLENAFKYGITPGKVEVNLKEKGQYAILTVNNSVEKMPDDFTKLFDRFYRENKSRNQKSGGYGIGLAIAEAIVKRYEGKLTAVEVNQHTVQFKCKFHLS